MSPQGPTGSLVGPDRLAIGRARPLRLRGPVLPAVAGHVHGQFQAAPDAQFVEGAAQVILDDLFAGADDLADFAIGQAFPDQNRDLNFFRSKAFAGQS